MLFVDSRAAVSSYVKGRSGNSNLDGLSRWIHVRVYGMDLRIWVEYIEGAANWADGISREGVSRGRSAQF